jgi:hypothetical protein
VGLYLVSLTGKINYEFYENRYLAYSNFVCKSKFVSLFMNHYTMKAHGGMKVYLHGFLTSALDVGEFTLHRPDSSNSLKEGSPCLWKSFWGLATILKYSWCLLADDFEACIDLRSLNSISVDCRAIQMYHWLVAAVWIALKDIFQENYMFCEVVCFGNIWMGYSFKSCL